MKNKKYTGFTLVEMLIVMGILSVLMAIGVAVARFAVQRANNIQHQSAVDQMFQAFQSYYTDNRKYPNGTEFVDFDTAFTNDEVGVLEEYVDSSFDGGSPATYYYLVDDSAVPQSFLVCVSFGGPQDEAELGGYCNGNGFGELGGGDDGITGKSIETHDLFTSQVIDATGVVTTEWDGDGWGSVSD